MDAATKLRDFIVDELEWKGRVEDLTQDYPLIENGVVDSLGLFMLLSFIADQFGVRLELEELSPQNLETIGAIVRLIEQKRTSIAGSGQSAAPSV